MELILNLVWAGLALLLMATWLSRRAHELAPRRLQWMSLFVVVLLLLPVISMSDDLIAAQGPAEVDTCLRRAQDAHAGPVTHGATSFALPQPMMHNWNQMQPIGVLAVESTDRTAYPTHLFFFFSRPPPAA